MEPHVLWVFLAARVVGRWESVHQTTAETGSLIVVTLVASVGVVPDGGLGADRRKP